MIKGFDEQTQPLSSYEETFVLPLIVRGLRCKIGKSKAVTNGYIVSALSDRCKIDAPRLRKVINYIRLNDLIPGLVATSDGYYVATSEQELLDYEDSLFGREQAIKAVREAIQRQRKSLYRKEPVQQVLDFQ